MAKEPKDKKALGKGFVERMLERVPADKRDTLKEVLLADDILEYAGEGALAKEDYTTLAQSAAEAQRRYDTVKAKNDEWYAANTGRLATLEAENARLKAAGGGGGGTDEPAPSTSRQPALPANVVTKEELQSAIAQGLADVATLTTISAQHQLEFGEALDMRQLIAHAVQTGRQVANGGYDSFVQERRQVKAEQARKREIQEAEERGAKKERERLAGERSTPPDSSSPAVLSASFARGTLRGLSLPPEEKAKFGVDAAVAGLHRRRQEQAG